MMSKLEINEITKELKQEIIDDVDSLSETHLTDDAKIEFIMNRIYAQELKNKRRL